jgi:MSHA pilin protein MshC
MTGRQTGFTLIELVGVMLLVGIMAVFVLPRMFQRTTYDARTFIDDAKSVVRYGQKIAIAQNRNVYVVFSGNRGALCFDAGCASHVQAPVQRKATAACDNDSSWMCTGLPDGVSAGISSGAGSFYFNALGRPFNQGDAAPTSTFSGLTVSVSGGGVAGQIVVEPETGYVH